MYRLRVIPVSDPLDGSTDFRYQIVNNKGEAILTSRRYETETYCRRAALAYYRHTRKSFLRGYKDITDIPLYSE